MSIDWMKPLLILIGLYLIEKIGFSLTEDQLELLETITEFNMEARFSDEKFSFKKRCTREFTEGYLNEIEKIKEWLIKRSSSRYCIEIY